MKGKVVRPTVIVALAVLSLGGCGQSFVPGQGFDSNDLAKQLLGETVWGDPSGQYQLTFDENARLIDIMLANLPEEFAGISLDGEPFEFTLPDGWGELSGQTVTIWVTPTGTYVERNEDGSYQLEMDFYGDVSGIALTALVDQAEVVFTCTVNEDCTELGELHGEFVVYGPFGIEVFRTTLGVNQTMPLSQL